MIVEPRFTCSACTLTDSLLRWVILAPQLMTTQTSSSRPMGTSLINLSQVWGMSEHTSVECRRRPPPCFLPNLGCLPPVGSRWTSPRLVAKQGQILAQLTRNGTQRTCFLRQAYSTEADVKTNREPLGGCETTTTGRAQSTGALLTWRLRRDHNSVIFLVSTYITFVGFNYLNHRVQANLVRVNAMELLMAWLV